MIPSYRQLIFYIALIFVLSCVFLFFCVPIDLFKADLGRHIMNGRLFFEGNIPFSTNFYSYSEPLHPTINHHWGYGVFIYGIYALFGFVGATLVNALSYTVALACVMTIAFRRVQSRFWVLASGLLVLPVYAYRTEVRPESLSMLFMAALWCWLDYRSQDEHSWKWWEVACVVGLFLLWVNIHLFFVLGWGILGCYFLYDYWRSRRVGRLFYLLLASVAVCLLNPSGLWGVLEPFMILRDYGYDIAENQTVFFIYQRFRGGAPLWFGGLVACLSIASLLFWRFDRRHYRETAVLWGIPWMFMLAGMMIVRLLPYFALAMIPVLAILMACAWHVAAHRPKVRMSGVIVVMVLVGAFGWAYPRYVLPIRPYTGVGLLPKTLEAISFMNQSGLRGPIFNNYDVGGYLIFGLFPKERVFVDNRPEAYTVPFLRNRYVAMQEDESVWAHFSAVYGFQSIVFDRRDLTPWAQPFLIRRLSDPEWVPVYVDHAILILVRKSAQNESIIRRFSLPRDMFQVRPFDR